MSAIKELIIATSYISLIFYFYLFILVGRGSLPLILSIPLLGGLHITNPPIKLSINILISGLLLEHTSAN